MTGAPTTEELQHLQISLKGRYRVGKKLGEGAQGTVFKVEHTETGEDNVWAVKITKHPKQTKGRRSKDEINARLLYHERTLYHATLTDFKGKVFPNAPTCAGKLLQYKEDEQAGWNFLVMEQMEQELPDAIRTLPRKNNAVDLSRMFQRMLSLVQQVHQQGYLVTDIKPENFMTAYPHNAAENVGGSLEERLRLVDLALFESFRQHESGHAPKVTMKGMRGTPLYASNNVHQLMTPSRRDDIESLIYVWGEMTILVHAGLTGKTNEYKRKGSFLPWAGESTDDAVGEQKLAQVSDLDSEYYSRMPRVAAEKLYQCWEEVSEYKYKKEPDYEGIHDLLTNLKVPVPTARTAKKKTPTKKKAPPPKRAAAGVPSPPRSRAARAASRASAARARHDDDDDTDEEEQASDMEVDEVWDTEENHVPAENVALPSEAASQDRVYQAALLEATSGPYEGAKWVIQEGDDSKIMIGSNPSKRGYKSLSLAQDGKVEENHTRLHLVQSERHLKILVLDNKSGVGTYVDKTRVVTNTAAFAGSTITVGDTQLFVRRAAQPT